MSPTRPNPPIQQQQSHQQPQQQSVTIQPVAVKAEPIDNSEQDQNKNDYDEKPTDLSMDVPTDLSNNSRHVNIVCSPDTINLREHQHYYLKDEDKK